MSRLSLLWTVTSGERAEAHHENRRRYQKHYRNSAKEEAHEGTCQGISQGGLEVFFSHDPPGPSRSPLPVEPACID